MAKLTLQLSCQKSVQKPTRLDVFRGEADGHEGPYEGDQPNGNGVGQVSPAVGHMAQHDEGDQETDDGNQAEGAKVQIKSE